MGLLSRLRGTPEDRFAAEVLDAVKATGAVSKAWYAPETFAIGWRRNPQDHDGWIYLSNTFRETAEMDRRERADQVRRLVSGMLATGTVGDSWEECRPLLRPVLRTATFGLGAPDHTARPLSRPALPFLSEFVVIDMPDSMAYVSAARLDDWSVTAAEVFGAAHANLADLAERALRASSGDGPTSVRFVDDGDTYYTSMLLVDGFLAGMSARVGGRAVAFVPDRNTLLVVPDQPDVLARLLDMMEGEYGDSVRSISPAAYTVDDAGAVVPYPVDGAGPLAGPLRRAEALLAAAEYAAQREVLEAQHEKDGTDIYVASLRVMERQDKSVFTVATWTDEVPTLLPQADVISFVKLAADGRATEIFEVPWLAVAVEVGPLALEGLDPVRYRVTTWPAPEVMDRLRTRAVEP
jgi:hypothetical protein